MTDQQTPAAPARKNPLGRIGSIVIAVLVVGYAAWRLASGFLILPGCDATNISDTVRDLFKSKEVELVKFEKIETLPDAGDKHMCGAYIESAEEKANIQYSIVWQGWQPYVTIEKVDVVTN